MRLYGVNPAGGGRVHVVDEPAHQLSQLIHDCQLKQELRQRKKSRCRGQGPGDLVVPVGRTTAIL